MMNDSLKNSKSVILPNIALIFALTYFSFVVSEEVESIQRRTFYILLSILDIFTFIYLNKDFYVFKNTQNFFLNIYHKVIKREEKRQDRDEIRNLIEQSVQKDLGTQDKYRESSYSYLKERGPNQTPFPQHSAMKYIPREREILNSTTKIDDRLMSGKMASPYKFQFGEVPQEKNIPFKFNPNMDAGLYSQNYAYNLLKHLQLSQKFNSKLKIGIEINQDQVLNDAEKLGITDYTDIWISNLKNFLTKNLIPDILSDHIENVEHLNRILENCLNIKIVDSVVDESEFENFRSEIGNLIRNTNLDFSLMRDKFEGEFKHPRMRSSELSGFNLLKQSSDLQEEKKYFKIFFGDDEKIRILIDILEDKIINLHHQSERSRMHFKEMENVNNLGKTLFSQYSKETSDHSAELIKSKFNIHNPLLNKTRHGQMDDYSELIKKHNKSIEENLRLLIQFLIIRLKINNHITPYFVNVINNNHRQLILEYNISRLQELKSSNFSYYKNDSGGNFKMEPWFSALPTDSQLISSILIKYIEDIFRENNITKPFLVNYPLEPISEKNSNSLLFYQMNAPGCQPHFNIYSDDKNFQCVSGKDNFFYAAVIFLYLMKTQMVNITKKLMIDQFLNMIIKF